MRSLLPCLLLLTACSGAGAPAEAPHSPCRARLFESVRFTVCSAPRGKVEVRTSAENGRAYRSFAALETALGERAEHVAFAVNAGMFDEGGQAIGLLVEDGKELHAINRREGAGNFHLLPNGVFLVRRNGTAEVLTSARYKPDRDVLFATQSGPMLLIDGKLHPKIDEDGQSRTIRNGVGIAAGGTPLFVISEELVSFGKLARFFRDALKVRDALYLDGSVSSLWDPANGVRDAHVPIGPMIVVFKGAGSGPDRESPATP
jgi:uncharacterized protein YigE (DUF2233 family)